MLGKVFLEDKARDHHTSSSSSRKLLVNGSNPLAVQRCMRNEVVMHWGDIPTRRLEQFHVFKSSKDCRHSEVKLRFC